MQSIVPSPPVHFPVVKRLVAGGLQSVAGALTLGRGAEALASPHRVIIVEPYGMGDAVALQPLVDAARRGGVDVTVCARRAWRELFPPEVSWVDCRVPWTAYGDAEKYRVSALLGRPFREFWRAFRTAARGRIGIDVRGDSRTLVLLAAAGSRPRFTLERYLASDLRNGTRAARPLPYDESLRRWQLNGVFLPALGLPPLSEHDRPRLRERFSLEVSPDPGRVGLVPLAPWPGKAWPREKWTALIARLQADGFSVVAMGGPGQESALGDEVGKGVPIQCCRSVREWADALSRLGGLVTVDTGPMHLADALDVPLVALYGVGCLPLWAPSAPTSVALHRQADPDYRPVHPTDAGISRGLELMDRHSVADVAAALARVRPSAPVGRANS